MNKCMLFPYVPSFFEATESEILKHKILKCSSRKVHCCLRPRHAEQALSGLISETKQSPAWSVLGCETN